MAPDKENNTNTKRNPDIVIEADGGGERVGHVLYRVGDVPPLPATLVFGLQVSLQIVSSAVTKAYLLSDAICGTSLVTAKLLSTCMFIAGLTTFIQSVVGVRLPVFQTPSIYYVVPILARAEIPDWTCAEPKHLSAQKQSMSLSSNGSTSAVGGAEQYGWEEKLMEVCGVLMVVSVIHTLIGATGLGGRIAKVIGPLTIAPAVVVMILKLSESIMIKFTIIHLGITAFTLATLLILTTYMANVLVPIPYWTRNGGWRITKSRFLRTYAVLISIGLGWLLCHILTVAGALPDDPDNIQYHARTDNKGETIELANWFYLPYPGQFGMPRFSITLFFGLLVAMLSSVIDSVADYNIVSRVCQIPLPPQHATNRGLLIEGFCSILAGAFGAGISTSTSVSVTGSVAITGVTSRRVFQCAGLMIMCLGIVGKIGAFLVIIPKPVVGAVYMIILGSVIGMLLAELNDFEMKRPRNCMTVGLSILMGCMVPKMIVTYLDLIDTGIPQLNNLIIAMFGTPLFVAGVLACFLDNTLPDVVQNTDEYFTYTMTAWCYCWRKAYSARGKPPTYGGRGEKQDPDDDGLSKTPGEEAPIHRIPYVHDYFTSRKWTRFCPFLPGFNQKRSSETVLDLTNKT